MTTTQATATEALAAAGQLVDQIASRVHAEAHTLTASDARSFALRDGNRVTEVRADVTVTGVNLFGPIVTITRYIDYGEYGRTFCSMDRYRSVAAAVRNLAA